MFTSSLCALVCALCALSPASAFSQDAGPPRALLKLGLEHDSNARRQTGSDIQADQLTRLFFKIASPLSLGPLGSLHAKLLLGAKSYQSTPDEDTLVTSVAFSWSLPLYASKITFNEDDIANIPAHRLSLFARADASDRSEVTSRRDYTRYGLLSGLAYRYTDTLQSTLAFGYRDFIFKPDLSSNHHGLSLSSSLSLALPLSLTAATSYSLIQRQFNTDRLQASSDGSIFSNPSSQRLDWLHALDLSLSWQGDALIRLRYSLQVNTSNSVGPALTRHSAEAFWVQPLPLSLTLQLRASILRTSFDSIPVADRTLQLDDENRNLLLASLRYRLPIPEISLESRYALYTQALGEDSGYTRHLLLLGLAITLDDDDSETSALE